MYEQGSYVVTTGEIMMRLQPPSNDRIRQARSFDIAFGGGEANVAVCLSQLGIRTRFVTAVPDNEIGKACIGELQKFGVDTSNILLQGDRLGIYFCEKGFGRRPSRVIYDRKHSSFAEIAADNFDYGKLLEDAKWLHVTGITPALSDGAEAFTRRMLRAAKEKGLRISCDLNYRSKLWSEEKAGKVMSAFMQYVDVLIANEEDAKKVFGICADATDIESAKLSIEGYKSVCRRTEEKFGIHTVAVTLRESYSASRNGWSALLYADGRFYRGQRYDVDVLDRVGGGDSFSAGLIYAMISGMSPQDAIEYAVACSCLKHSVNGDFHIVSHEEVLDLIENGGSGRVRR